MLEVILIDIGYAEPSSRRSWDLIGLVHMTFGPSNFPWRWRLLIEHSCEPYHVWHNL